MTVLVAPRPIAQRSSTVTVQTGSPTGSNVNQNLRGCLHPFGWPSEAYNSTLANMARTNANGLVNWQRTDKLLTYTPIKTGGTDGTHPSAGHSGSYSYDWQVVDRTLADIASQGATPYFSLDSNVTLLGGTTGPYTGTALTTQLAGYGGFDASVPNNFASYATMCVDLIHHVIVEKGVSVPYWGVGNEPDGGEFWNGTSTQFFQMFAAISNAVKAYNSALKIGGPELLDPIGNFTTWIQGLMSYCQTNSVALDFISYHEYYSMSWPHAAVNRLLAAAKTALSWTSPLTVICGEWANAVASSGSSPPFSSAGVAPTQGDEMAAYDAIAFMQMQQYGIQLAIRYKATYEPSSTGDQLSGLFSSVGPWASGNVWLMWSMLGAANVLTTTLSAGADPGLHAMGFADASVSGRYWVLIANDHYRRGPTYLVTVSLPGIADGKTTTLYVVDQYNSNQLEASTTTLQTIACPNTLGGQVVLPPMQARSVYLLEIAP